MRAPEPTASVRVGSGEPLLLIHPFMLNHEVWTDVVPGLADDFEVVAATLPGHWGGPGLRRRDVSLDAFADGLEELMDDLGWETAHVAGCSIGGWLSLELAARGRARSVTAIAPAGGWRRFSWAQIQVGLKFLMIAPMAFLGHALGDLARHATPLVRGALGIVSARPAAMPRRQVVALIHATTHCSAFLPFWLGWLTAMLGLVIRYRALSGECADGPQIGALAWTPLGFVFGAVLLFGWLLPNLGLVVTLPIVVVVAALAGDEFHPGEAIVNAIVLTALCWAIFIWGLELTMPLLPAFLLP